MNFININRIKLYPGSKAFLTPLFLLFFSVSSLLPAYAKDAVEKSFLVRITNDRSFTRKNEIIRIKRAFFGYLDEKEIPLVTNGKKRITYQLVDNNIDGRWDVMLLEVTLSPHSSDLLTIKWTTKPDNYPQAPVVADVRLSLKSKTNQPSPEIKKEVRYRGFSQNIADPYYQMEGPGIENDKVAFRAFFDYRNGKDIYGKIVNVPVLSQVGVTGTWHKLQWWGMDIWKVGNSLGAGALAVMEHDKLFRLADADTSIFSVLYQGPLAAAFQLKFKNWDIGTSHGNGSETISMTKGDFFYKDEIKVSLKADQFLASGMANFGIDNVKLRLHNLHLSSLSTYGNQAEGTDTKLGTAIVFSTPEYLKSKTTGMTDSIPNTSYVSLKNSSQPERVIYFFACWEKTDARFHTEQGFDAYLNETATRLAYPVKIELVKTYSIK
jgi:hypothetical protein